MIFLLSNFRVHTGWINIYKSEFDRINDLLTGLLGPYYEIRSPIFSYGPSLRGPYIKVRASYFQYGPNNPVSKSLINGMVTFQTKATFLQDLHCMVRGSNVYESLVRYLSVRN